MVIFLIVLSLLLACLLAASLVVNVRYGNMLINVEDNIETCLDILDRRYRSMMHIFDESPGLVSDEPLVQNFIKEVKNSRDDILIIANIISKPNELVVADNGDDEDSVTQDKTTDDAPQSEKDDINFVTSREKENKKKE